MPAQMPTLAEGVEGLGRYHGSAYTQDSFLARRPDGQVVQLSSLLYLLLESIDGKSSSTAIASRLSGSFGRPVSADNVDYLLETKFAPLGLLADSEPACSDIADTILALRLRVVLLQPRQVQWLGRRLAPLFLPWVIGVMAASLLVADAWLLSSASLHAGLTEVAGHPVLILLILCLALASALFHECGHAAACSYGGARPGVIGMGIYVVWPAFYTNVTDSYRLTKAGRVRTDLGGVYFNAVFALALAGAYVASGFTPLLWAILIVHIELIEQLIPTFRFDGYFILGDLAGVPDLFSVMLPVVRSLRPGRPADPRVQAMKRGARLAITAWVLLAIPVLVLELAVLIYAGPQLYSAVLHSTSQHIHQLVDQFGQAQVLSGLLTVLELFLLFLPLVGLAYVLQLTCRRLAKPVARLIARAQPSRSNALVVGGTAVLILIVASISVSIAVSTSPGSSGARHVAHKDALPAKPATTANPAPTPRRQGQAVPVPLSRPSRPAAHPIPAPRSPVAAAPTGSPASSGMTTDPGPTAVAPNVPPLVFAGTGAASPAPRRSLPRPIRTRQHSTAPTAAATVPAAPAPAPTSRPSPVLSTPPTVSSTPAPTAGPSPAPSPTPLASASTPTSTESPG
jgi:putative peptide zinc metalloprotease protein